MKEKNLPDDNDSKSFEKLTQEINSIIEKLEKQEDLKNSLNDYQELIKLNNIIEKKFQKKSKSIKQDMKEKIESITNKKNAKQS
jgi:exonuclease VII small subunit